MEVSLEEGTEKKNRQGRRVRVSEKAGSQNAQLQTWVNINGEGG